MASNHFDLKGAAWMVDVASKPETLRTAVATGGVVMQPSTLAQITDGTVKKGDVLGVARIAAIAAVKRTAELIPLCHPVRVVGCTVDLTPDHEQGRVHIRAEVKAYDRTGIEMEALTAVTIAALTVYDMCKSRDRAMVLMDVRLEAKTGGRSGTWQRAR